MTLEDMIEDNENGDVQGIVFNFTNNSVAGGDVHKSSFISNKLFSLVVRLKLL